MSFWKKNCLSVCLSDFFESVDARDLGLMNLFIGRSSKRFSFPTFTRKVSRYKWIWRWSCRCCQKYLHKTSPVRFTRVLIPFADFIQFYPSGKKDHCPSPRSNIQWISLTSASEASCPNWRTYPAKRSRLWSANTIGVSTSQHRPALPYKRTDEQFQRLCRFAVNFHFTNTVAGHCVQLVTDYSGIITKDE